MKFDWKKDCVMGMLNYYYKYTLELSDEITLRLDIFEYWSQKKYEAIVMILEKK